MSVVEKLHFVQWDFLSNPLGVISELRKETIITFTTFTTFS